MESSAVLRYDIHYFNTLDPNTYEFIINEDVIKIINLFADKVGAPSYSRIPNFKNDNKNSNSNNHNGGNRRRRDKKIQDISDEDWDTIRNFHTTALDKAEGINKSINDIRTEINKVTVDTYNTQLKSICTIISELVDSDSFNNNDKVTIGKLIFDVACSNKFYSSLYANIIFELSLKYQWLTEIFNINMIEQHNKFLIVENADPDGDYEQFCKINKDNANRKALTSFYISLMKNKFITLSTLYDYIDTYNKMFETSLHTESVYIVEQLAENICILIEDSLEYYTATEFSNNINNIILFMQQIKNSKVTDYPGLSNKTIFRIMDVLDNI